LWLASLGGQAIEGDKPAPLLRGNLGQGVAVLTLVAGQERERELVREITHVGLREADLGGQCRVHLAVGSGVLIAPPAKAHQDIGARGRVRKGKTLRFGGQQAQACPRTRFVRTPTRAAGHREDPVERRHRLLPCQIVAQDQQVAAVGTGQECRLRNQALLGV
jgi:hypothetical protein